MVALDICIFQFNHWCIKRYPNKKGGILNNLCNKALVPKRQCFPVVL